MTRQRRDARPRGQPTIEVADRRVVPRQKGDGAVMLRKTSRPRPMLPLALAYVAMLFLLAIGAFATAQTPTQDQSLENWMIASQLLDEVDAIDGELITAMQSATQEDTRDSLSLLQRVSSEISSRLLCLAGKLKIQELVTEPRNQKRGAEIIMGDVDRLSKSITRWRLFADRLPLGGLRQSDVKTVLKLRDYLRRLAPKLVTIRYSG